MERNLEFQDNKTSILLDLVYFKNNIDTLKKHVIPDWF